MNFYKHYLGDFQRDTSHLGLTERGAYLALLHHYYATEQALPSEYAALCRIAGAFTKPERDAVKSVSSAFFERRDGLLWHKRVEAELEKQEGRCDKNRVIALNREARKRAENEARLLAEETTERARNVVGSLHVLGTETAPSQNHSQNQILFNTNQPTVDPAFPVGKPSEAESPPELKPPIPDTPHLKILALWTEVLPALPQHNPEMWNGTRADHLRARWRETAAAKKWPSQEAGLAYFRKLFGYVGTSPFLTGKTRSTDPSKRPFTIELEWLVLPSNWAKVHEGKYHSEG
jgi:uncharacterized protein YdaU (DUF1376 family)